MKTIKKIAALLLVVIMALTVVGCHKKDEIAVTIDGIKFTSAYYMCALVNANMEAKNLVAESLTDEEKQETEIDYFSKKVEDKKFVDWVEDKAIETLKEIAAYKLLCKENKIEPTKDELSTIESNASFLWSSYGYSAYFEPNGVSLNTYTAYTKDAAYSEKYFEFLYGKEGKKAISDEEVNTKISENFQVANVLDASYEENATDESKKALKTQLENYAKEIQEGKKTFEQVYAEFNGEEDHHHEETEEDGPKDPHAQILGAEGTNYANTFNYEKVKAMKVGEVKVIDNQSNTGLTLLVKHDLKADPYYTTTLDMNARHLIADKDFEKEISDYTKKLKPEISKYAIGQFKVKNIEEPTYNY